MNRGISVIIPCYNDGRYLEQAVRSCYEQNIRSPHEFIIIDDGSTDALTLAVIKRLQEQHPDLRVVTHSSNKGLPAARNTGLAEARYPFVSFLDSDDLYTTDPAINRDGCYVERAAHILRERPDVAFVYCRIELFEKTRHPYTFRPRYDEKDMIVHHHIGSQVVYRRQDGLDAGGYNERLRNTQDWDFNIALVNQRIKEGREANVVRFEEPFLKYRIRADNSNITANHTVSRETVVREITARNTEIYERYFPGLKGESLVQRVNQEHDLFRERYKFLFLSNCIFNPRASLQQGAAGFVFWKGVHNLSKLWAHVSTKMPHHAQEASEQTRPALHI